MIRRFVGLRSGSWVEGWSGETAMVGPEIASAVRSGARTATEFTDHALAGVAVLDPVLHFIDSLAADSALAAARRIDASPFDQRGALAGVPFLAKAGTSVASPVVGRLAAAGSERSASPT
jgi:Asp-tRNA(Asn)/Glu-tRNA(Gln) amidotransferase A subunit family amidase